MKTEIVIRVSRQSNVLPTIYDNIHESSVIQREDESDAEFLERVAINLEFLRRRYPEK